MTADNGARLAALLVDDLLESVAAYFETKLDDKAMLAHLTVARSQIALGNYFIAEQALTKLALWFGRFADCGDSSHGDYIVADRPNAEMRALTDLTQAREQLERIIKGVGR